MAIPDNAENYFQTDTDLATSDRKALKSKNTAGRPIRLSSKLNAIARDPRSHDVVYVAESGGKIRRIDLVSSQGSLIYHGADGPATSVCVSTDGTRVFGGSWDKHVYAWDASSGKLLSKASFHTDFVKCLVCVAHEAGEDLLLSGGADGAIVVYSSSASGPLRPRQILHTQSGAIQDIAIDVGAGSVTLFIATSGPDVLTCMLPLLDSTSTKPVIHTINPTRIPAHDTSVYRLTFDDGGDLWSASADKSTKRMTRSEEGTWEVDTILQHPDYVRDMVVCERRGWAITACRDEEVRVWDIATGKVVEKFSGHFQEVMGLCLVGIGVEEIVVSVGIDGTARRWRLADVGKASSKSQGGGSPRHATDTGAATGLTAEEECELAELMENEERELQELMAADEQ